MLRSMRLIALVPLAVAVLGCSAESEPDEATSAASGVSQSDVAASYTFRVDGVLWGHRPYVHSWPPPPRPEPQEPGFDQPAHIEGAFDVLPGEHENERKIRNLTYKMTLEGNERFAGGELASMDPSFTASMPPGVVGAWKDNHSGILYTKVDYREGGVLMIHSLTVVDRSDKGTALGQGSVRHGSTDRLVTLKLQADCDVRMTACKLDDQSGVQPQYPIGYFAKFVASSPLRLTPKAR